MFYLYKSIAIETYIFSVNLFCLQIRVLASDGGTPARTDTTVVSISVERNLNTPSMSSQEYTASLLETQPLGEVFTQVQASDADQKVRNLIFCNNNKNMLNEN